MTWQLMLFVAYAFLSIMFIYYLNFMELIIDSRGIKHSIKNYFSGPTLLIKRINTIKE